MAFSTRINRYSGFMAVFAACLAAPLLQTAAADVVLPDGYTRLNYIESTDSQYVKTGYKPVWGDRIECKAKIKYPDDDSLLALFGKRDSSDAGHYCFAFRCDGTQYFGYGGSFLDKNSLQESSSVSFRGDTCNYLKSYDGGFIVNLTMQANTVEWARHDGTKRGFFVANPDSVPPEMNRELYIFGINHADVSVELAVKMRLYSFRATSVDGTVKCDFVPCYRHSDSAVGLYDTVSGRFLENANTSKRGFTAGPAYGSMPLGFKKAKYIQSVGAEQIIDTGYVHGTNDLVVMDYYASKSSQVNGYNYLFGARHGSDHSAAENWYFYIGGKGANYITYNHKTSQSVKDPGVDVYDYACDPVHLECQASTAKWVCAGKTNSLVSAATYADWTEGKCSLYIFGGHFRDKTGGFNFGNNSVMRLYSFKIYRDIGGEMVLVHDFIPCISGSGAAGLYDILGDRFHGNIYPGSTDFDVCPCDRKLPPDYTKVDYIESTAARQYIDTVYWHGTNDLVVMDYYAPRSWQSNGYCYLFGSRSGSAHSAAENWYFYIGGKGANYITYNHNTSISFTASDFSESGKEHHYDYTDDPIHLECQASTATWSCGDHADSITTSSTFSNWTEGKCPLYIFSGNFNGQGIVEGNNCVVMRLYSFKIYRDIDGKMVLVRDFVPCRNPSGAVGLYDLVEERFHGNANRLSGEDFVAAPPDGLVISVR